MLVLPVEELIQEAVDGRDIVVAWAVVDKSGPSKKMVIICDIRFIIIRYLLK